MVNTYLLKTFFLFLLVAFTIVTSLYIYSIRSKKYFLQYIIDQKIDNINQKLDFIIKFTLQKSKMMLIASFLMLFLVIFFLCGIELLPLTQGRKILYITVWFFLFLGSLICFCDYFLSQIIITNDTIFLRSITNLFRPHSIQLSTNICYDTMPNFIYFAKYYIRIIHCKERYSFLCVADRDKLIKLLAKDQLPPA